MSIIILGNSLEALDFGPFERLIGTIPNMRPRLTDPWYGAWTEADDDRIVLQKVIFGEEVVLALTEAARADEAAALIRFFQELDRLRQSILSRTDLVAHVQRGWSTDETIDTLYELYDALAEWLETEPGVPYRSLIAREHPDLAQWICR